MQKRTSIFVAKTHAIIVLAGCVMAVSFALSIPVIPDPSVIIGSYRIQKIQTGISIFQPGGTGKYYNLSAAQDYGVTSENLSIALARWSDKRNGNIISGSFANTTYETTIEGNRIRIDRTIQTKQPFSSVISVIPFNRDDIVIDDQELVYTETLPEYLTALSGDTGIIFTPHDIEIRRPEAIKSTYILIVNPTLSGILVVRIGSGDAVSIDKDAKQILIKNMVTPNTNPIKTTLVIDEIEHINNLNSI